MRLVPRLRRPRGRILAFTSLALFISACLCMAVGPAKSAQSATVTLSLARYPKVVHLEAGPYAGVFPGRVVMHVGDSVVFVNSDSRHHTATGLMGVDMFPDNPQWTDSAVRASGKIGGGQWSTGDLAPGSRSAPIAAVKPGTYLYGCFYDYSAGMRGEIVVEP